MTWANELPVPDMVFYLAGADPFEKDTLGGLSVTMAGLEQRDRMVFEFCRRKALPLTITLAGGYADEITDIVEIQFRTITLAQELLSKTT